MGERAVPPEVAHGHAGPESENLPDDLGASLFSDSRLSLEFVFLVVASCILASLGLLANSTAVIIGAMIVAPLMMPIRAGALGALGGAPKIVVAAATDIGVGIALSIGISAFLGLIVPIPLDGSELLARTQPTLLDLGVALAAGAVSAFAKLRPAVSDAVAGTAIAVALMPPLCVVGLTLSHGQWAESAGAFLLFATNLVGIALACMAVFAASGRVDWSRRTIHTFSWTIAIAVALGLPLTIGLKTLFEEARLEGTLKHVLVTRTVTFGQRVKLVALHVHWQTAPPQVQILVRAEVPPTPHQVALLEQFVNAAMGRKFKLSLEVTRTVTVEADEPRQGDHPAAQPASIPAVVISPMPGATTAVPPPSP
jgi:uncharacterized hydrophobic protein (TIGR00271 family)